MWDSYATENHYIKKDLDQRIFYEPGTNVFNPLVELKDIFLPSLRFIQLGLIKKNCESHRFLDYEFLYIIRKISKK